MAVLAPVATSDLYYDPLFPADQPAPEYVSPLLSQPVVELCLRIPSYVLFENGNDRGLARRAFAAEIPPEILSRQWKDRVQGFTESILLHGRTFARELLLDGVLVKQGLLDARKIETALSGRDARSTVSVGEILDHLVVEAWLRSWITNVS
jgi:asparagine synthase (glutamine-hydrolysing)